MKYFQLEYFPIYGKGSMAHKMNRRCVLLFLYNCTSLVPRPDPPEKEGLGFHCLRMHVIIYARQMRRVYDVPNPRAR